MKGLSNAFAPKFHMLILHLLLCIQQIRGHMSKLLNVQDNDDDRIYHPDLSTEINQWRKRMRSIEYLMTPMTARPHVSINSQLLDNDLHSFSKRCKGDLNFYAIDV